MKTILIFFSFIIFKNCSLNYPVNETEQSTSYRIVFTAGYSDSDIYTVDNKGNHLKNVTNDSINNSWPSYSPDKKKIVYNCYPDICVVDTSGLNKINLTKDLGGGYNGFFSPDGRTIIYRESNNSINTIDFHGNQNLISDLPGISHVKFTPDGEKLVFLSGDSFSKDLFIMNVDGSERKKISSTSGIGPFDISSDGNYITYIYDSDIFLMTIMGNDINRLTNTVENEYNPFFSNAGNHISFLRYDVGNPNIYTIIINNRIEVNLTENIFSNFLPDFHRQSNELIITSYQNDRYDIFTINILSKIITNITSQSVSYANIQFSI